MDRTRKRDGRTDGRTVRLLYASQSSFGGIKIVHAIESMQSVVQKPLKHDQMGFQCISISVHCPVPCADPEEGQRFRTPPPPLKNHKNIEFLSNTGPDPPKFSKPPAKRL